MTETTRAYIYRLAFAGLAIIGGLGYLTDNETILVGSLITALLPAGLSVLNSKVTSEGIRTYLYGATLAALPILTYYGVVEDTMTPQVIALAAALFSVGTAAANTDTE